MRVEVSRVEARQIELPILPAFLFHNVSLIQDLTEYVKDPVSDVSLQYKTNTLTLDMVNSSLDLCCSSCLRSYVCHSQEDWVRVSTIAELSQSSQDAHYWWKKNPVDRGGKRILPKVLSIFQADGDTVVRRCLSSSLDRGKVCRVVRPGEEDGWLCLGNLVHNVLELCDHPIAGASA